MIYVFRERIIDQLEKSLKNQFFLFLETVIKIEIHDSKKMFTPRLMRVAGRQQNIVRTHFL